MKKIYITPEINTAILKDNLLLGLSAGLDGTENGGGTDEGGITEGDVKGEVQFSKVGYNIWESAW